MAEYLTLTEARNYKLSTGATADLPALVGNGTTEGKKVVNNPAEMVIGQVAYVHAMGQLRRGVVVKLTKTKIHVALVTQGNLDEVARYNYSVRVQTTAAAMVYIDAPAAPAPVEVVEIEETPTTLDTSSELAQSLIEADHAEALEIDQTEELTLNSHGGKVDHMNNDESTDTEAQTATEYGPIDKAAILAKPIDTLMNSGVRELTGSAVVRLLERVHARIRQNHPEVPEVVIVTGAGIGFGGGKWGHFRPQGWTAQNGEDKATHIHEMFMAGETLAKGSRQVLQTMIHESAHALAEHRGEKDTSRQGRWHNQVFRKTAEELGLEYKGQKADKALGFSQVTLTAETVEEYKDLLEALDAEIHLMVRLPGWLGGTAGSDEDDDNGGENMGKAPKTGPASTSNNTKLTCECEEPNIIRASKKVAAKMVVRCDDCEALFAERD